MMSEEPSRRHNRILIIGVAVVLVFVSLSVGYVSAFQSLQIGTLSLGVQRVGFTFSVVLFIPLKNPSALPIPTFDVLVDCLLNGHVLFSAQSETVGSLNARSSCVINLWTEINMGLLAADLVETLVQYLAGQTISYSLKVSFIVHLGMEIPIYVYSSVGSFKL
jgi:LEA14-like dessication related protein